jgi:hypothetical protein
MPVELVIRFLIGGLLVSAFAMLGDLWRPKTFAGLFGAAPSIALASLGLAFISKGADEASVAACSMVLGAVAILCYSLVVGRLLLRGVHPTLVVTAAGVSVWFGAAFGLWAVLLE